MTISTEKKLLQFRRQYIEWGNILIPFGPSRKNNFKFVYHLPAGVELSCPYTALELMIAVYQDNDVSIGADPSPTMAMVDGAMALTRLNDPAVC